MRKLILFMHTSLDGYVGGPGGEMDWIRADDEMFDLAGEQTGMADTALYGRVTYQMMEAYWPTAGDQPNATKHDLEHSQWYNSVEKVIFSRTLGEGSEPKRRFLSDNIPGEIEKLKRQTGKNMLMFGSPTAAHLLMEHNLIDDYWIFINPILLGSGIPLFKDIKERIQLKLADQKVFSSGVTALHYEKTN